MNSSHPSIQDSNLSADGIARKQAMLRGLNRELSRRSRIRQARRYGLVVSVVVLAGITVWSSLHSRHGDPPFAFSDPLPSVDRITMNDDRLNGSVPPANDEQNRIESIHPTVFVVSNQPGLLEKHLVSTNDVVLTSIQVETLDDEPLNHLLSSIGIPVVVGRVDDQLVLLDAARSLARD